MLELILIPIVGLIYFFSYPPNFVAGSAAGTSVIWILTSIVSPKRLELNQEEENDSQIVLNVPMIKCPACQTSNPVTSDERPLKINCSGCGKTIKIVG